MMLVRNDRDDDIVMMMMHHLEGAHTQMTMRPMLKLSYDDDDDNIDDEAF